jgi:hypothetical protein
MTVEEARTVGRALPPLQSVEIKRILSSIFFIKNHETIADSTYFDSHTKLKAKTPQTITVFIIIKQMRLHLVITAGFNVSVAINA